MEPTPSTSSLAIPSLKQIRLLRRDITSVGLCFEEASKQLWGISPLRYITRFHIVSFRFLYIDVRSCWNSSIGRVLRCFRTLDRPVLVIADRTAQMQHDGQNEW